MFAKSLLTTPALTSVSRKRYWCPTQTVYRVTFAVIGVLIALVVLFVVAVGASAVFQPGCESCHMVGEFKVATDASPHGEVDCTACHGGENIETRLAFGTTQVTGMYLRLKPVDPSVAVGAQQPLPRVP